MNTKNLAACVLAGALAIGCDQQSTTPDSSVGISASNAAAPIEGVEGATDAKPQPTPSMNHFPEELIEVGEIEAKNIEDSAGVREIRVLHAMTGDAGVYMNALSDRLTTAGFSEVKGEEGVSTFERGTDAVVVRIMAPRSGEEGFRAHVTWRSTAPAEATG